MPAIEDDIRQALDAQPEASRQERVFLVARIWHRHTGTVPTAHKLREILGRGSYSDLGRDLRQFVAALRSETERAIRQPGLPEPVRLLLEEAASRLWVAAAEAAESRFADDRATIEYELEELRAGAAGLQEQRETLLTERSRLFDELADGKQQISGLDATIAALRQQVSEAKSALAEAARQSQADLARLASDLAAANRVAEAKDVAVAQLRQRVEELQGQCQAEHVLAEEYRNRLTAAESRLAAAAARLEEQGRQMSEANTRLVTAGNAASASRESHEKEVRRLESELLQARVEAAASAGQAKELRERVTRLEAAVSHQPDARAPQK